MVIMYSLSANDQLCPVCGYAMDDPPRDYNICPSCGTEFGVSDVSASISELREAWIRTGPKWWSAADPQPQGWNPFLQLARLGLSSGMVVSTTSVVRVTSATSDPEPPISSWGLCFGARAWGQSVSTQFSLELR